MYLLMQGVKYASAHAVMDVDINMNLLHCLYKFSSVLNHSLIFAEIFATLLVMEI